MTSLSPDMMTEIERKAQRITDVRLGCLQLATALAEHVHNPDPVKWVIDRAKELEAYAWNGFMPNLRQVNPIGTIKECCDEALIRLNEYINNSPEGAERTSLLAARAQWERFSADLHNALGKRFS